MLRMADHNFRQKVVPKMPSTQTHTTFFLKLLGVVSIWYFVFGINFYLRGMYKIKKHVFSQTCFPLPFNETLMVMRVCVFLSRSLFSFPSFFVLRTMHFLLFQDHARSLPSFYWRF